MSANDPRLYNVNRDVAHNFDFVVQELAKCVEDGKWPALTRLAKASGVSDRDLGKACESLILFIGVQADNPKESMASCLSRCGFMDVPETARIVAMAYLGNITLGIHHAGVREATLNGQGPALTYQKLRGYGRECVTLMTMPKWRRRLLKLKQRIRRAWRALTEKNLYDA